MVPLGLTQNQHLAEREEAISAARAALRAEREQIAADRAEANRLLSEARAISQDANHDRARARRLAARFVSRVSREYDQAREKLEADAARLQDDRRKLDREMAQFEEVRSDFHVNAAEIRARLHESWTAVQAQKKRVAQDWIAASHHLAEETAILNARAQELDERERRLTDAQARAEAETAGFREEAAALETRIENTRQSLADLEAQRDQVRKDLLGAELSSELSVDAALSSGSPLDTVGVAVAALSPEPTAGELNDRARLVSEQLGMLVEARAKWRQAEEQTVAEMEQLARELDERARVLDQREQRLIRSGIRQREEAYSLWHLRLRLEAWQTKLTAFEARWRTEREELEADLSRRQGVVARRETDLEQVLATIENVRTRERERLRGELELWADDRARFEQARADFERRRHELMAETSRHAAKALAAEAVAAKLVPERHATRAARRIAVLRRRWEWVFERKVREVSYVHAELAVERTRLDERYRELQAMLQKATDAVAALHQREAALLAREAAAPAPPSVDPNAVAKNAFESAELISLRNEVERLALLLLDMERPERTDQTTGDLPWADEPPKSNGSDLLPFDSGAWAA